MSWLDESEEDQNRHCSAGKRRQTQVPPTARQHCGEDRIRGLRRGWRKEV